MSDLKQFKLSKVDFHRATLPVFSEVMQKTPWVYYGTDNLLPQYFTSLFDNCAIHKSVIYSKVNQIMGDGLVALNNPMAVVNLVNDYENIEQVIRKCALDYMLFGGFALQVIWAKDHKSIAEFYHLDFSRVRASKLKPEEDKVDTYWYCTDWANYKKNPPKEYPAFEQDNKDEVQIYYYRNYLPGMDYYPVPDWSAGQRAIEINVESLNFHMNNLRKGMVPSLWINYNNGIPGEEEQRILVRALEEQYGGTDNAGQAIVSFNESKEQSPEIVQIPRNDNDNYYKELNDDITRTILSAHRVSSAELFGIATAGKLGAADEITEHSEYFRKMVIQPYQNQLLPVFNKMLTLKFDRPTTLDVKPLSLFLTGDVNENPVVEDKPVAPTEVADNEDKPILNDTLRKLSGREYQNMMRIIRNYNKGTLTREQAVQMLMNGYGLSTEETFVWLGDDND